jgi:predicted Zn-dependent protease
MREQGRERYCELQPQKLEAVADWLKPFHKRWEHHFDKLDIVLQKMKPTKKTKK